jgi:cellobiose phosphorylase
MKTHESGWRFTDSLGTFEWHNPPVQNELYFPVCNEAGLMASVTPSFHGDCTVGQHGFIRLPLVMESLHNTRSARNFWIYASRFGAYSLTGNSAAQRAKLFGGRQVDVTIRGAPFAYTLRRVDHEALVESELTLFCPAAEERVEIMLVTIRNLSTAPMSLVPTTCLPLYCRSADSVRDHNHWTSLSHRMRLNAYGLSVTPAMHHDERGHRRNETTYFALAAGPNGEAPVGQFPTVRELIGEGGSFDWPRAIVENLGPDERAPCRRDGMEAVGAIRFAEVTLAAGEAVDYVALEGAGEREEDIQTCLERYGSPAKARDALRASLSHWRDRADRIQFATGDRHFDTWMRWVSLQPTLRKIYGNSFLPHFDYGRGGRGWRDLWQDCLTLLLQAPHEVRDTLVSNYSGVRLDGSNATIVEKKLGAFAADRNRISRVWMDHGAWPWFTTKLYIDQTGDVDVLFELRPYWKDHQVRRAEALDTSWKPSDGTRQKTAGGDVYEGTLLEHILVQHLTCFHNVGEHNNIRLEDGDWNDLCDMARARGESVAFSAFYGFNMVGLAGMLRAWQKRSGKPEVTIFEELLRLTGLREPLDYDSIAGKRERLGSYFDSIGRGISGKRATVSIEKLAEDLEREGQWLLAHVRTTEWIESRTGNGFFNGYYNNDGERVDGDNDNGARLNLTAQAFAVLSGAASEAQVRRCYDAAGALLKDPTTGGYRLTTPLGRNTWNFGRGFAVVYGEKETGGMFSHMAVIFLNALYRRGFVREGWEVFTTIYRLANDIEKARIYPGIPEYINNEGAGKYHYLTGSASWLVMTVLNEMYGFKGTCGDLLLAPKLVREQFDAHGEATARTAFLDRRVELLYRNRALLDYDGYRIASVRINGRECDCTRTSEKVVVIDRATLTLLLTEEVNTVDVELTGT